MNKDSSFGQRLSIVGPPLLLILVGGAVYLTVQYLRQPSIQTIEAVPQQQSSPSASQPESSSSATLTTITTQVTVYSASQISDIQKGVDGGQDAWYLNPLSAAKELGRDQGFTVNDAFSTIQASSSASPSQIQVKAIHQGKAYTITMHQPGINGAKGIWLIKDIAAN